KLGQSLDGLERDLDRDRSPLRDAQSWPNTLPLSAALGYADMTTLADPLWKQFNDIWTVRKKSPEPEQAWQKLREAEKLAADPLRLRAMAYLLGKATDGGGSADDPAAAADLLQMVDAADPGAVRPAEAHFLLMLR